MSYSFSVVGTTKEEAKKLVAAKLDEIVAAMPEHAHDQAAAYAALCTYLDLTKEPKSGQKVHVNMNGALSWMHPDDKATKDFHGATVGVAIAIL